MPASSVTGKGKGASQRAINNELAALTIAPTIIVTGIITGNESMASPPGYNNRVNLPYPLEGGADKYVVLLTTIGGGDAYITGKEDDDDGNFIGFNFVIENEGEVMYMVAKVGIRPKGV